MLTWQKISKAFALTASGLERAGAAPEALTPKRCSSTGLSRSGSIPTRSRPERTFSVIDFRGIGLENAAIAAQQVEQQQIRDCGAVGNAPAFDPGDASAGELPPEFGEKPRLADAGLADEADCLPLAAFDLPQEIVQNRQLALPVDESCPASRPWMAGGQRALAKRRAAGRQSSARPCL